VTPRFVQDWGELVGKTALVVGLGIALVTACATAPESGGGLARTDHYVALKSSAPGLNGGETRVYVREISAAADSRIPRAERVVLFVHGGAFPGSTVFDLPQPDYSWMRYFANAGYDTFAMDFTGFGSSTRPAPMSDPCNVAQQAQAQFVPVLIPKPCPPSHPGPITTMESEWEEMDAVIEHLRKLRGVDKVSIVAWSRGGPRTSGYLIRHSQKVSRVFALAPDYNRAWPSQWSKTAVVPGGSMQAATQKGFNDNWASQLGCEGQVEAAVREAAWKDSVSTDAVGASWGPGVRRQLPRLGYGVNPEVAKQIRVPFAMAAGTFDKVVLPAAVRAFYDDLASSEKVLVDLGCSSHFAMWEKNRELLFKMSLDWVRDGKINGVSHGELKLGY
jgi:pimeloyl-ACP methyl ester carboxylesterase